MIGFVGLVLVAVPGGGGSGAGLTMRAAAALTGGTLLARRLAALDLLTATGWHLVIGGASPLALAAVVEGAPDIAWTPASLRRWPFFSFAGTAATTVVWFVEAGRSRLDILSAWTLLTPVFGSLLSAAALGEVPARWTAAGLAVVLVSVRVVLRPAFMWGSVPRGRDRRPAQNG